MRERPILFTGAMVRAILSGSKSQTRRVVKYQAPDLVDDDGWPLVDRSIDGIGEVRAACPYGQPGGGRLYVRETWAAPHAYDHLPPRLIPRDARIHYAATEDRGGLLWRPSIHMPRWASRITLEVTGVRVELLQDISIADALAEGVDVHKDHWAKNRNHICSPVQAFADLWKSINGPDSWTVNPWVFVIEFKRINP